MLRAERASRRITHPHASYTSDGKLLCNLCETLVKSEAQWQSHLHSTQHVLRSQRAQEAREARNQAWNEGGGKKRKAETLDNPSPEKVEDRKRKRPATTEEDVDTNAAVYGQNDLQAASNEGQGEVSKVEQQTTTTNNTTGLAPVQAQAPPAIDDEEFAAFERDLAAASFIPAPATSALNTGATISAPAMTAEELAAQAREEQSAQRGKRDREIEEEKEDAARAMEEEFEEMEGLEERVRKLRERREALRVLSPELDRLNGAPAVLENGVTGEDGGGESDEEDEDDGWGFGGG